MAAEERGFHHAAAPTAAASHSTALLLLLQLLHTQLKLQKQEPILEGLIYSVPGSCEAPAMTVRYA